MIREVLDSEFRLDGIGAYRQPEWPKRYPWILQGVTSREANLDFGGAATAGADRATWEALRSSASAPRLVRVRQVHGAGVVRLDRAASPGVDVLGESDALVTDQMDVLVTLSVADCVPIFLVDPKARVIGIAHAGWRGIAAGVVESTMKAIQTIGGALDRLTIHLGPAICEACYVVGSEVPQALGLAGEPRRVDLRACAMHRAVELGVDPERVTRSARCTRCEPVRFFSYRGGDESGRVAAFIGMIR